MMLTIVIILLLAVSAVNAADYATEDIADVEETLSDEVISVEETQVTGQANDDEAIGETDDGTFTVLQQKIDNADINATITLSNNYEYDDGFNREGIRINKDLTIDGQGYTINAFQKSRIFKVEEGHNVVFKNITFNYGYIDGDGGAIYGECTAVNCTFYLNQAQKGGAICGGSAVNCTFTKNHVNGYGGAMYDGSAVNCDFNSNTAFINTLLIGSDMDGCSADTCSFSYIYDTEVFNPSLSVEDYASFYNSGDKLAFNLSTHSGMRVTNRNITIDIYTINGNHVGTFYSLSDGWVVPLGAGEYVASCKATDFDMDYVNATLKILPTVNLAASYNVSVLDDGFAVNIIVSTDPAINDNLTIRLNGKDYSVEVVNGIANFISDKVYSNDYNTEIIHPGAELYNMAVVVKSTKVTQLNTFTYYYYNNDMGSDSEKGISQIKVVDSDGNPIKNGLVTITIMNKYKLKVRTNSQGIAKFTKAYKPGTYSLTVTYDNKVTKLGNLVLKSVVNLPKVSKVSKSAKTTTIKITLKGTGPIKGKTVVVSFMKVNYKVQTDKNGVALFKVTKNMVSKLAVGKTYTVRATYRMDSVAQGIQILK